MSTEGCLWRIVISPNFAHDSSGFPVFLRFCYGNLVVLFILWFAKAPAETQDAAVLRGVVLLRLSRGQSKKTLKGTNPSARGGTHYKGSAESRDLAQLFEFLEQLWSNLRTS
jgi:hypothetical protein